jgi:hypothetical protein
MESLVVIRNVPARPSALPEISRATLTTSSSTRLAKAISFSPSAVAV